MYIYIRAFLYRYVLMYVHPFYLVCVSLSVLHASIRTFIGFVCMSTHNRYVGLAAL